MSEPIPLSRRVLFWGIALGGTAFDLTAKALVFRRLGPPGTSTPLSVVPDILDLRTSYNKGALWGFGSDLPAGPIIFAALSLFAAGAICWYLFIKGAARDAKLTVALALIMAGALGNCFDRVALGHVRDFVYFHVDAINFRCAIFNFADNMLVAGAVLLMLMALKPDAADAKAAPATVAGAEEPPPASA